MAVVTSEIISAVTLSLAEDVGGGDITAALIPEALLTTARIIAREPALIVGQPWFIEVYRQLDPRITVTWLVKEAGRVGANDLVALVQGPARLLLTGERTALNWLQTLSGTATVVAEFVAALHPFKTQLLDTRKTIPGLRFAQKYAVRCGGGVNHRMGLFDAFLIKENHIAACGSIEEAVRSAQKLYPDKPIEVEVEDLQQLEQAIVAGAHTVMLDNFTEPLMRQAVLLNRGRVLLEVSGNVTLDTIATIAETGVDFISVGALTKHVRAIDLSMRLLDTGPLHP